MSEPVSHASAAAHFEHVINGLDLRIIAKREG